MTAIPLAPGLRCLTAPNPSPMTLTGTHSFLIGTRDLALIDPGPLCASHQAALLEAIGPGQRLTHVLVTHSHLDHSPLARPIAAATGAVVLAAGPSDWGRSARMQALARAGTLGGGEGVDPDFVPDRQLGDGEWIEADGWRIQALHTPGHMANHLSFAWKDRLFVGDLVMGWSTSLISPPDGDLTSFRRSLTRLMARDDRLYHPAHGDRIEDPQARCRELLAHRAGREDQILAALMAGPATPADLAARIYHDTAPALMPAATRNVLAHLIDLVERNLVVTADPLTAEGDFALQ